MSHAEGCRWCADGLSCICGHEVVCLLAFAEKRHDDVCDDCYEEFTNA